MNHEQIIVTAAEGKAVDFEAFTRSCEFFMDVAGIEVPGDGSYVAPWHPSPETPSALPAIREWYSANKERLYWDTEREAVMLRLR